MAVRGDREVDLGSLGMVPCRPGLRALEAIESSHASGSLTAIAAELARAPGLRTTISILYECHLDFAALSKDAKRHTREQIAAGVLEVGLGKVKTACWDLVFSAWAITPDPDAEPDSEKA